MTKQLSDHRRSSRSDLGTEGPQGISRRSFLIGGSASVAALLLPCLGAFGDKVAYALDYGAVSDVADDLGFGEDPETHIVVISRTEIGFSVYEVDGEGVKRPLPGAKVTLSESDTEKTLEGIADEDGVVVFDVAGYGKLVEYGTIGSYRRFEGSVTITNGDEYRICTLTKVRLEGGSALALPCCRIGDASIPYFEYLSFCDWDIQYCDSNMLRSGEARDRVSFKGKLRGSYAGEASVSLWARSKDDAAKLDDSPLFTTSIALRDGAGTFSKSDYFLRLMPTSSATLPLNRTFEFHLDLDGVTYVYPVKLALTDSTIPYQTGKASVVPNVSYGQSGNSHTAFTLPSSFPPVLRNSSFTCWVPTLPFDFWLSPLGYLFLGTGLSVSKDAGNISALRQESFALEQFESAKQQLDKLGDAWDDKIKTYQKMKGGTDPGSANKFSHQLSKKFGLSFAVQAFLSGECNILEPEDKQQFEGVLAAVFDAYGYASFTETFTVGPVPLFVTLNLSLDLCFSLYNTFTSPEGKPLDVTLQKSATGAAVVLTPQISVSLGVGLSGFLAASFVGSGYLSFYTALLEADITYKGPRHFVIGGGFSLSLVLQAAIYKWSGSIWSINDPRLYDNWIDSSAAVRSSAASTAPAYTNLALGVTADGAGIYSNDAPAAVSAQESGLVGGDGSISLGEFARLATIVTSAELLKTKELAASAAAAGVHAPQDAEAVMIADGMFAAPLDMAGAEDALDEGEDGYLYEYVGEDPDGACGGLADVAGIAEAGGVVPTKDVKIVSKAFSNPRERVVVYNGATILFRLASVDYTIDGKHEGRTRLVAQIFNDATGRWGRPKVLDIPITVPGIDRADQFDCDFDVCTQTDSNVSSRLQQGIYVFIVSTTRKSGDSTSFFDAACSPILTVAVFNRDLKRQSSRSWTDEAFVGPDVFYAVTCPRVTTLKRDGVPVFVVATYLRHAAHRPELLFSDMAARSCGIAAYMAATLVCSTGFAVPAGTSSLLIAPAGDVASGVDDGKDPALSLFLQSGDALSIATVTLRWASSVAQAAPGAELDALRAAAITFDVVYNIEGAKGITGLQPWPGHSAFLTLEGGDLVENSFDPLHAHGALSRRTVGPSSIKLGAFRVSENGNVLVFVENREGACGQNYDDAGNPTGTVTEKRYRFLASIYVDGLFSEPFPLGQTKHPLNSFVGVSGANSYVFVTSCITDMGSSMADLYYVDIPVVVAASVVSIVPERLIVAQGEDAGFFLVIRNDGNVMLTGCRVTFFDAETGEKTADTELSFASENVCASAWNPELFEDGAEDAPVLPQVYADETVEAALAATGAEGLHALADPVASGVLLPGKKAQYRAVAKIPTSWHGTKSVYAVLSDFSYRTVVSAAPDGADPLPMEHTVPHDEAPRTDLTVHSDEGAYNLGLSAPATGILMDDGSVDFGGGSAGVERPGQGGSGGSGGSGDSGGGDGGHASGRPSGSSDGKGGPSGGSSDERLAATGDAAGIGAIGLLAGAAALGMGLYSARRTALENEEASK